MRFKIGDVIIMNKRANDWYGITRKGSIGIIIDYRPDSSEPYRVRFTKLVCDREVQDKTFWISDYAFDLLERLDPKQAVIKKIAEMDKRRKDLGYAF